MTRTDMDIIERNARAVYDYISKFFERYDEDKEWEEYEKEIDAQVDAVFKAAETMNELTDLNGIPVPSDKSDKHDDDALLKSMKDFNESLLQARKRNRSFPFVRFLITFGVSMLIMRYLNPAAWTGKKD